MAEVRLLTVEPGHFHAALVQREMYAGVSSQVHVYAELGPDLLAHLQRIVHCNTRPEDPTSWLLEIHTGPDSLGRMVSERLGNAVVISGRNRRKIDLILAAVEAGFHVLADKPWVLMPEELPKLRAALDAAEARQVIAYDIMTERYEITSILQRELVNDPDTFGTIEPGTDKEPGVFMESLHYIMKKVAGVPNRRPPWYFDIQEQGEGLNDVGTHLVDLVWWILFPGQPIDAALDVRLLAAKRWPTELSRRDYQTVTGAEDFLPVLAPYLRSDHFDFYCNTYLSYQVRGIHVALNVLWDFEAVQGEGDTHFAVFRGSRSRIEVRQGMEQNYRPELYVVPNRAADRGGVLQALQQKVALLQATYPEISVVEAGAGFRVAIPSRHRTRHESHFSEVTRQFLRYLEQPQLLPQWEKPNMLAKYFVATRGVRLAQQQGR